MEISPPRQQLLELLADGAFHSGNDLAKTLGMSRSAVWKHLHELETLGLEVAAVAGKGYRLSHPLEVLDARRIDAGLEPRARELLASLEIFQQIDSTNRYLIGRAGEGAVDGTVCLAESQTAGRGRRGREWLSPFGSNVYLSVLWRFQRGPAALAGLSLAAGVAVVRALTRCAVPGVGLKWPNDLYWRRKKLGGILVEVSGESHGPCSGVLGLGLNFHLPRSTAERIDQPWADLGQIMGKALPSRNGVIAALLNELLPMTATFEEQGLNPYLSEWRAADCFRDDPVTLYVGSSQVRGVARGISDNGLLVIEGENGERTTYASGEVSLRGG